jgi:hypothetical protein
VILSRVFITDLVSVYGCRSIERLRASANAKSPASGEKFETLRLVKRLGTINYPSSERIRRPANGAWAMFIDSRW